MAYVDKWRQYQQQNDPSRLFEASDRALDGARFAIDAWQEFFDAFQGWCEEAVADGYPPGRVIPDVLTFQSAWCEAAKGLCRILVHTPEAALETNEESEMAGPVIVDGFTGTSADIEATDLVNEADPTALFPKEHVMLRVPPGGGVMITLVGIRRRAAVLPAGTYRGEIRRVVGGAKVLDLVSVHRRKGTNQFIVLGGGVFT